MKALLVISASVCIVFESMAQPKYPMGCADPAYQQYIDERFVQLQARNKRLQQQTLRDYELSLSLNANLYQVIANLSRHLKYSAQFDPYDEVTFKIARIFEHSNELTVSQQIAGDVLDGFSNETHSVGIARAWLSYRRGRHETAFQEMLKSIDVTGSALISSFGPDFDLIRQIYRDGHIDPVVTYIQKTKQFWTGKRADELRAIWLKMIEQGCKIQFDSLDTITAADLGIRVFD